MYSIFFPCIKYCLHTLPISQARYFFSIFFSMKKIWFFFSLTHLIESWWWQRTICSHLHGSSPRPSPPPPSPPSGAPLKPVAAAPPARPCQLWRRGRPNPEGGDCFLFPFSCTFVINFYYSSKFIFIIFHTNFEKKIIREGYQAAQILLWRLLCYFNYIHFIFI